MVKVLLVDDEQVIRESIAALIQWEQLGLELIASCANAFDALECMTDEMPDILLTDIKMPVMDGLQLIEQSKAMHKELYSIVLSGYAEFTLAQDAIRQGAMNYLLKPYSKEALEEALVAARDQVLLKREGVKFETEQRKRIASELVQALLQLKAEEQERINRDMIMQVMIQAGIQSDLSLLQDALVILATRYAEVSSALYMLHQISKIYETEDILAFAAEFVLSLPKRSLEDASVADLIMTYVEQNFADEGLTLQYIADEIMHMDAKYIGRCFTRETGRKFSDQLLEVRMDHAQELLLTSANHRVQDIAEAVGLGHNPQYFYQLFKKYTGLTPGEYRSSLTSTDQHT